MEVITPLLMQCPVIGVLVWFIVAMTRENSRRLDRQCFTSREIAFRQWPKVSVGSPFLT